MNKSKDVLKDLIRNYKEDFDLYDAALENPQLDQKQRTEILLNMVETAIKLQYAVEDLKKEIRKEIQNG